MSGKPQAKAPKASALAVEDQVALDEDAAMALDEAAQVQTELDSLSEKCAEEILQVEQRFNKLRKPFVELRSEKLRAVPEFWMNAVSTCVCVCVRTYYMIGWGALIRSLSKLVLDGKLSKLSTTYTQWVI